MKSILSLLILLFVMSNSQAFSAENTIERVTISPKRILLYCSHAPLGFSSQLSPDKRRITLNFPNYSAAEETRMTQGKGFIEDVYCKQSGKNIQVMIQLNDKKGFTAVKLPYSNAVMIDVFSWDSLSKSDDLYRTALLGSEKEISASAYQTIAKSADLKCSDALFFSGINALQTGDLDKASARLNSALENKSTIPDIYAALAQIARLKHQDDKAKRFQDEYAGQSGIRSILDIPAQYQPPTDSTGTAEPVSLAMILDERPAEDTAGTLAVKQDLSVQKSKDTTRFASIFAASASAAPSVKPNESGMIDEWMKTGAIAGVGFVVTAAFYLAWLYFRWRKSKLKARIDRTPTMKFDELLAEKADEPNRAAVQKAASMYKQGSIINREITEDDQEEEEVVLPAKKPASDFAHLEEPLPRELLLQYADTDDDDDTEDEEETPSLGVYFPPNEVELAMHLQQEGLRHKSTTLRQIATSEIPHHGYELSKVARKFGVERSSLEVKRTLAHLETDTRAMESLLSKFSGIINNQMPLVKG